MRTIFTFLLGVIVGGVSVFLASNESFRFIPVDSVDPAPIAKCNGQSLTIDTLTAGQKVTFPLTIGATVDNRVNNDCYWTIFEGQAGSVKLTDKNGTVLATDVLATNEDWMQLGPVHFYATIEVSTPIVSPAELTLIFEGENPSGDPNFDQTKTIPITY